MKVNTSKMWRSGVALLLALCLVVGFFPTAAFAVEIKDGNDDGVINYVSFGASNVNGFGVEGYIDLGGKSIDDILAEFNAGGNPLAAINVYGLQRMPKESYPYMFAEALNEAVGGTVDSNLEANYDGNAAKEPFSKVKVDQMGISSMRMEELGFLLGTFAGDSYTDWRFYDTDGDGKSGNWFGQAYGGSLEALQAEYIRAIKEADVITMDMGMNNFGVYISHQVGDPSYDETLEDIDPELAAEFEKAKEYVGELVVEYASKAALLLKDVSSLVDALAYAVVGYCHNFDKIMEKIYELNPDVNVVVVSIQNLMTDMYMDIPGVGKLPLGDIFGAVIDVANLHTAAGSPYCDRYVYADVRKEGRVRDYVDDLLDYNGDPATLSQNMKDCFTLYDYENLAFPLYALSYTESCTVLLGMLQNLGLETIGLMAYAYLGLQLDPATAEQQLAANALQLRAAFRADAQADFAKLQSFGYNDANALSALKRTYQQYTAYEAKVFDTMYDVMVEIMQAGVLDHTIRLDSLNASMGQLRRAALPLFQAEIQGAFAGLRADMENYEFTLREDFYDDLAIAAGMDYETLMDAICMYVRTSIGNSFYSHPSPEGHRQIADAVMAALRDDITGKDVVTEEIEKALESLIAVLKKYAPEAWEQVKNDYEATGIDVVIDDDFKYVALGDGTAVAEGYAEALKAWLEEKAAEEEKTVAFVNAAKVGNSVAAEAAALSAEVVDADLITLGFSQTDMLANAMIAEEKPDWAALLGAEAVPYVEDALALVAEKIAAMELENPEIEAMLNSVAEAFAYNAVEYAITLPTLIQEIRQVNEDAVVIVVGMYNPVDGVIVDAMGETLDMSVFSAYVDYLVEAVCVYGVGMAMLTNEVDYADAREVEINEVKWGLSEVLDLMDGDASAMYPSEAGDLYIAEQIKNILNVSFPADEPVDDPADDPVDVLYGDADGDGFATPIDAMLILQYYVGDIADSALNATAADVDGDGFATPIDAMLILQYYVGDIVKFPVEANEA